MAVMPRSLQAWGSDNFHDTFKAEMEGFRQDVLPLRQTVGEGNSVYDGDLGVVVNGVDDDAESITVKAGVFFAEIVSCCSCGEGDPIEEAYCELLVNIDKQSGEASFEVLAN